ncbi:MAG: hypothetical protein HOE45_00480 [Gammaproteobacteria bacterium]|jgi:tetratricopeptide (TPR) repeat protein|nr:hypothetical protein [Gammaproteobacteria bacterium]MBT4145363.1 hypothetical protein [Gammaproteobacteria bacterium]MBT5221948.1 hypothetical protein [Gammaproteobacteria bacterium]MBT5825226.1 hypothetical protein [Gammaproteobacteria bacterium]MBT5966943.1 hypothetical protein [Gammaproteobacteria bacterium]
MHNIHFDNASNIFKKVYELVQQKKIASAISYLNLIIDNYPDVAATAYHYKGYIYFEKIKDFPSARKNYSKAIEFNLSYCEAYISRAVLYRYDLDLDKALADISIALQFQPDNATALFNKAIILLSMGQYELGWELFESRLKLYPRLTPSFLIGQRWNGMGEVSDKTLMIYTGHALGTSIQFFRYLPIVLKIFRKVILYLPPQLNIIAQSFGQVQIINTTPKKQQFDYFCSLLSLPHLLKNSIQTIPNILPYINLSQTYLLKWQEFLDTPKRKRIGIAWRGERQQMNDKNSSMPLMAMHPLMKLDADIYLLNKDISEEDYTLLHPFENIKDYTELFASLEDTAALMHQLDYIVTVDNTIAHLAGALNLNVLILLPYNADFRWLQTGTDSTWYPCAQLFRQIRRSDWEKPIQDILKLIGSM